MPRTADPNKVRPVKTPPVELKAKRMNAAQKRLAIATEKLERYEEMATRFRQEVQVYTQELDWIEAKPVVTHGYPNDGSVVQIAPDEQLQIPESELVADVDPASVIVSYDDDEPEADGDFTYSSEAKI
jgi:hypothetical protein